MDWTAPHLGFVAASYVASLAVLAGLALALVLRDRRVRRDLEAAERRREERA